MVATCGGVFFGVAVWVALTAGLAWLAVFLIARYASLASIVAGLTLPVCAPPSTATRVGGRLRRRRRRGDPLPAPRQPETAARRAPRTASTSAAPHAQIVRRRSSLPSSPAAALWLAPGRSRAGWCGAGESATDRPDAVTGAAGACDLRDPVRRRRPVRDRRARSPTTSRRSITWWQGQDPTRDPRFDQAAFPAAPALDISFLKLSETAAARRGARTARSARSRATLEQAGFTSRFKKYLVYYDGPSRPRPTSAASAAASFDAGPGLRDRLARRAARGAHRHDRDPRAAARARRRAARRPNACPGDAGHPCDSTHRRALSLRSGEPLSPLILDFNHDDYYGHSGTWPDIQDSPWLHRLDVPAVPLGARVRRAPATDERPARASTARALHDAVGSGRG